MLAWLCVWTKFTFAYGPADAISIHCLLLQKIQINFTFLLLTFCCQLTQVVLDKIQEGHKTVMTCSSQENYDEISKDHLWNSNVFYAVAIWLWCRTWTTDANAYDGDGSSTSHGIWEHWSREDGASSWWTARSWAASTDDAATTGAAAGWTLHGWTHDEQRWSDGRPVIAAWPDFAMV